MTALAKMNLLRFLWRLVSITTRLTKLRTASTRNGHFYAGYLQTRIWDRLGEVPTRSQLIHFLVDADRAFNATGQEYMEWPGFYAKLYIEKNATS